MNWFLRSCEKLIDQAHSWIGKEFICVICRFAVSIRHLPLHYFMYLSTTFFIRSINHALAFHNFLTYKIICLNTALGQIIKPK